MAQLTKEKGGATDIKQTVVGTPETGGKDPERELVPRKIGTLINIRIFPRYDVILL